MYKTAVEQYDQGAYEEAAKSFSQILEIDSTQERAREYVEKKIPNKLKQIEEEKLGIERLKEEIKQLKDEKERLIKTPKAKFKEELAETPTKSKKVAIQKGKDEEITIPKEVYEEEYRIKPFDTLTIKIYQEEEISGDYKVQRGGFIDMPLLRKVQVEGLTVYEAEDKITALLAKDYLVDPQIMINVKEYHSEKIVVLGQVAKPGTYELSTEEPITLLRAISMAGGFTNIAAINKVKIIRIEGGKKTTIPVRANEIIDGKKEDIVLKTGDMVVVPESFW